MKTIKSVLIDIANLIVERDIIEIGDLRCLYSELAEQNIILSGEKFNKHEHISTIGDDKLSDHIKRIADNLDRFPYIFREGLYNLIEHYTGEEIESYICPDDDDELSYLIELITLAEDLLSVEI